MSKLKRITPLERQIDILQQHIKRRELDLQELYALRPVEKKKGKNPRPTKHKIPRGRYLIY